MVALRKESVDRNPENPMICIDEIPVALRKESVDRNTSLLCINFMTHVALRKESVDRNLVGCINRAIDIMSLSARRAWIEIASRRRRGLKI